MVGTAPAGNRAIAAAWGLGLLWLAAAFAGCGSSHAAQRAQRPSSPIPNRVLGVNTNEHATRLHLSAADCGSLDRVLIRQVGRDAKSDSEPSPPLSFCRLRGHGLHVTVSLDTSYGARQRYTNRMVEQAQFGAPDRARLPHPVAGVGDPSPGNQYANWVPAYNTLYAVRGNRWLTVVYSVAGESETHRRAEAADLARRAFRLSAH